MSWGANEEGKPAGGEAGSTIDNECQAWWVRIRKFLGILVTDTTPIALGSGADEDNPALKAALVDDSTIEITGDTQINVKDGGITLAKHASDSVDENKIVSTTLGAGLAGGSGTTLSVDGLVEQGASEELACKKVTFSGWNMDTGTTKTVAHGLTAANIRSITVLIKNNANNLNYMLSGDNCGHIYHDVGSNVILNRKVGGLFDNAGYNAASGWVMIWYKV